MIKSDIEIARETRLDDITVIAGRLGISDSEIETYGRYKAKIGDGVYKRLENKPDGKLILVTAVNPTPAGEGKTTTTVGLGQALSRIGKKAIIALREPSLGPVFGMKGGAAGGGYSQVLPMEDINLHFTGDLHAVTAANNLLCALIDNHIQQGNALGIDPRRVLFPRVLDINDRALRSVVIGLGGKADGFVRQDSFTITVASEIMAILCLCENITHLKEMLSEIIVAYTFGGGPVRCRDLRAQGALCALLKDAIKPNLVQTTENTPCLIHGGPFANIAHGCNSVRATRLCLKLADYTVTEAGFGADLGAEKFFDIKCRKAGLKPSAAVIVVTAKALKYNGGVREKDKWGLENLEALKAGSENLVKHIENIRLFGLPAVVAFNRVPADTETEIQFLKKVCEENGAAFAVSEAFAKGSAGAVALAEKVVDVCDTPSSFRFLYEDGMGLREKIETISRRIYGADGVVFDPAASEQIRLTEDLGGGSLPVCMAKTQYSLTDDPAKLGRPKGFYINIREVRYMAGAGFTVAVTGKIMTMPGLPKVPCAESIDVDAGGNISGLF